MEGLKGVELKKYECETIVNFNELEEFALVYTSSKRIINKLLKLGYEIIHEDKFGKSFKCSKKCISFRDNKPKEKRNKRSTDNLAQNKGVIF